MDDSGTRKGALVGISVNSDNRDSLPRYFRTFLSSAYEH